MFVSSKGRIRRREKVQYFQVPAETVLDLVSWDISLRSMAQMDVNVCQSSPLAQVAGIAPFSRPVLDGT